MSGTTPNPAPAAAVVVVDDGVDPEGNVVSLRETL
jgi:hypothetical protein